MFAYLDKRVPAVFLIFVFGIGLGIGFAFAGMPKISIGGVHIIQRDDTPVAPSWYYIDLEIEEKTLAYI